MLLNINLSFENHMQVPSKGLGTKMIHPVKPKFFELKYYFKIFGEIICVQWCTLAYIFNFSSLTT